MMRRLLWNDYWRYLMLLPSHAAKNRKLLFQLKAARPMLIKGPHLLKKSKKEPQNTYSGKRDSTPTPATSLLNLNVVFKPALRLAITMPFRTETRRLFSGTTCSYEGS